MLDLLLILLSVVGLCFGPFLVNIIPAKSNARLALDAFTIVTICGMVLFHLFPEAYYHGGGWTLLFGVIGVCLPLLLEKLLQGAGRKTSLLLLIALIPHIIVESAVFGVADRDHAVALGIAISAHRIPVGLLIFTAIQQQYNAKIGWQVIGMLMAVTLIGFWGGDVVEGMFSEEFFSCLQALVGGALLHVVFSHRLSFENKKKGLLAIATGILTGLCFVGVVLSGLDIHH